MTDNIHDDVDDADRVIDRSVEALQLAGVSGSGIAAVLLARSVILWRQEGFTDARISRELAACISVPLGRNG